VLKHADLAERLTHAPLKYKSAEQWNGYVAPAAGPWGPGGGWVQNDSPYRRAIVEIASEAYRRELETTA
jgi:hypothetical protein